ncbi:hypothetical protein [Streptomyces sp. NPDC013455]|uniref:hypothetical protein n=1 Tax=Streptomyces sp. NPDC013455 TaxID=3155605 RepID=UPI0033E29964
MEELLALAAEAVSGTEHHLVTLQLPFSLVMMTPIAQALRAAVAHSRPPPARGYA